MPTALGEPLKLQYRFYAPACNAAPNFVTVQALTGIVEISSAVIP